MKKKDLQSTMKKDLKDIADLAKKKKLELAKSNSSLKVGREKNLKKVKNLRHELAQILTIIRQKEIVEIEEKRKEAMEEKVNGKKKAKEEKKK